MYFQTPELDNMHLCLKELESGNDIMMSSVAMVANRWIRFRQLLRGYMASPLQGISLKAKSDEGISLLFQRCPVAMRPKGAIKLPSSSL